MCGVLSHTSAAHSAVQVEILIARRVVVRGTRVMEKILRVTTPHPHA